MDFADLARVFADGGFPSLKRFHAGHLPIVQANELNHKLPTTLAARGIHFDFTLMADA